jgi:hypothetical protein
MIKFFYRIIILLIFSVLLLVIYLSIFGIETEKFNKQIRTNLKNFDPKFDVKLNKVKLILNPLKFNINIKTLGPTVLYGNKSLELETIKTDISLKSLLKKQISSSDVSISTKSLKIKELIAFSRTIKNKPELFLIDRVINSGYLIADIDFNFDNSKKIFKDLRIKGFIKDGSINLLNKNKVEDINFIFRTQNKLVEISDLNFNFKNVRFKSEQISIKNLNDLIQIKGSLHNDLVNLSKDKINELTKKFLNFNAENINFSSKNQFFIEITKKYKIKNFNIDTSLDVKNLSIKNSYEIKNFLPEKKEFLDFKDHKLNIKFSNKDLEINGKGKMSVQKDFDQIEYNLKKLNKKYSFDANFDLKKSLINLDFLNFKKEKNSEGNLKISGTYEKDLKFKFANIFFKNNINEFKIKKLFLNKYFKVESIDSIELNFIDLQKQKNHIYLKKVPSGYNIKSEHYNANKLLNDILLDDNSNKLDIFKSNTNININFDKVLIGDDVYINNLNGFLKFKNNEIVEARLSSQFNPDEKLNLSIISKNGNKVTTFYSPKAKPFVKRYKFIKGFEEGSLDYYSVKNGETSKSKLKIYDFKLKELPALTKILTLASLQGIADLLSGEGIRFNEFEMSSENKTSLTTINEIYAIGPAISILMDGYIEKSKLVSLRGTLVPATTINKVIGSIPILGDILVGKKTGEGVFGVSFKIKGPPKKLETSVNPIKTLTPRFITRTLEKIKKN